MCCCDPSHAHYDAYLVEKPSGLQKSTQLCILEERLERNSQNKMSVGTMNRSFIWNLWLNAEVSQCHAGTSNISLLTTRFPIGTL